jgi:Arc/MetJ family transcription regulator
MDWVMRTNIDIDDALLSEAMKVSGHRTKKATVEEALRQIVEAARQRQALKNLRGLGWEGDLDEMRTDWSGVEPSLDRRR